MKKEQKIQIIDSLTEEINASNHFYLTDISEMNAEDTSALRRACFEKDIKLVVVKNTLLKIALEKAEGEFEGLDNVLKGATSLMLTETGNLPAKLIKEFRKEHDKPILKAAYVEESLYIGDNELEALTTIKSKEELIGDIVALLQSPIKNVVSSLESGKNILAGVVKTLSEKE
ncbi:MULTISPECIES: 50S ribosomal protein L10 [Marinifilum]|jgi:large subunit ribosomal protein L10|uniref:Large ribosomal subunit protein uL10 n=1 Tax=Marinifilum flexuosum TaxID=1117708 RepID=A0A419WNH5_9BACT|nr:MULTISPECIES: 50S ribosomal protein L10 [Marinifilum]MDQ2178235.1 50S ribosomal protein L10 [Marinifilum sp. D714]RKD96956.1 LSU ribosomal protein L10P [Marinifilum flexuosum]